MRTPAAIARALGWPEARRVSSHVHYPLPTTAEITAGVVPTLRLHVCKLVGPEHAGRYRWVWRIVGNDRNTIALDAGRCPSQPQALAVGLAALEQAHARARR